jgi:hypothetical protein
MLFATWTFSSAGFQLGLLFMLGHRHSMTLSAGYAAAFRKSDKVDDEILISLQILVNNCLTDLFLPVIAQECGLSLLAPRVALWTRQ